MRQPAIDRSSIQTVPVSQYILWAAVRIGLPCGAIVALGSWLSPSRGVGSVTLALLALIAGGLTMAVLTALTTGTHWWQSRAAARAAGHELGPGELLSTEQWAEVVLDRDLRQSSDLADWALRQLDLQRPPEKIPSGDGLRAETRQVEEVEARLSAVDAARSRIRFSSRPRGRWVIAYGGRHLRDVVRLAEFVREADRRTTGTSR